MTRKSKWAQSTALHLLTQFTDAAAIDTADYQLVSFIKAAAEMAIQDSAFAKKIEELVAPQRPDVPSFIKFECVHENCLHRVDRR